MSTLAKPPLPPPPEAVDHDGGDWDDSKMVHYTPTNPDGTLVQNALCGAALNDGDEFALPTPQQLAEMPKCPVCVALATYDGRWRLP